MFLFGSALGPFSRRLIEWVHEEGFCDAATRDKDWVAYTALLTSGEEPVSEYGRVLDVLADFCRDKTKEDLLEGAMRRSLLIAPVHDVADVLEWSQLESRGWWVTVDGNRRPGGFGKLSATPMRAVGDAPLLGAHTSEVRGEDLRVCPPPAGRSQQSARSAPLAGLKVLDFSWVIAGPTVTRRSPTTGPRSYVWNRGVASRPVGPSRRSIVISRASTSRCCTEHAIAASSM